MKTLTEFAGMNLKNAAKVRDELVSGGKTAEELPQAMGEALKVEGDRLSFLMNSLETVGTRLNDLKRVVILTIGEGEKAPQNAIQKGEHYFIAEYYPPLTRKSSAPSKAPDEKDRGKRKGKKGRDGREGRGGKRPHGPRPDRAERAPGVEASSSEGAPQAEATGDPQKRPRRRRPRKPLPPLPPGPGIITPRQTPLPRPEQAASSTEGTEKTSENTSQSGTPSET